MIESIPARWYCLTKYGAATLCVDELDARKNAAEADLQFPRNAPHAAVQMAPVIRSQNGVDSRHEFRQWARTEGLATLMVDGRYADEITRSYWACWEASRITSPHDSEDLTDDEADLIAANVEELVGMGAGAWDTIPARDIAKAFAKFLSRRGVAAPDRWAITRTKFGGIRVSCPNGSWINMPKTTPQARHAPLEMRLLYNLADAIIAGVARDAGDNGEGAAE